MSKKSKAKEYSSYYYKGSRSARAVSFADRRKTVGSNLNFAASEAYKLLRTNLAFSLSDEGTCKTIGVTSALRGEGKSSTAINLAYTIAMTGSKVLMIEADMRIPVAAKTLNIPETPGLSNVLAGMSRLNDAVRLSPLLKTLFVLPAGDIPPNPSEMLSSVRMEQMLKTLSEVFDYMVVDLPPVNVVSDSLAVSKLLNGMIMVVRQNYCDQHSLAEAMRQLEFAQVKVLGFVMNDAEPADARYKKYGRRYQYKRDYRYGYGQREKQGGGE